VTAGGKRILIVEDDRFLRRACQARLEQQGYTIVTAQDGEEALRAVRAQEGTRSIPVLVLSNSSRQEDMETIRGLGISGYFVKANLSLQDLSIQVKTVLDAR
jgi:CheY-like chemotaxis protein